MSVDELAIRLARAHYVRTKGEDPSWQVLDDLTPGIAGVWRTMALTVQDVLGMEGTSHAMAAMDNVANDKSRSTIDAIRRAETATTITPMQAVRNVFGEQEG